MAVEEILGALTFFLLLGAALTSLIHVLTRLKEGKRVMSDFTIVISIFIVGWLSTELMAALSRGSLRQVVDSAHLLVLVAFALALSQRWRWAIKEATESLEG